MALITRKKKIYKVNPPLHKYIEAYGRGKRLGIRYEDLARYNSSIPLLDKNGKDTLWETVYYHYTEEKQINDSLRMIYAILKAGGDISVMEHLFVDRVDVCVYGNTRPFRVRIMNRINDLFDYYYVKIADASRIYGLELEHLLSPNKINFLVDGDTLIEEHIQGIPGDDFFRNYLRDSRTNELRLAKEFIKFNERCLVRLLGDMHSSNFVIEMIPDFDDQHYRIKAIDFDQQSYEGRRAIYMPQFYKQNNPIIRLGMKYMGREVELQYQKEERSLIANRIRSSNAYLAPLLEAMAADTLAPQENEKMLREELAVLYKDEEFLKCRNMGEIVRTSLKMVFKHPLRKIYNFQEKKSDEE